MAGGTGCAAAPDATQCCDPVCIAVQLVVSNLMLDVLRGRQLLFDLRCTEDHCSGHAEVSRCRFMPRCAEIDNLRRRDSLHVRASVWQTGRPAHCPSSATNLRCPRFLSGKAPVRGPPLCRVFPCSRKLPGSYTLASTWLHIAVLHSLPLYATPPQGRPPSGKSSMTTMSPVCVWLSTAHCSAGGTAYPGSAPYVAASVCPSLTITTKAQPHLHNSGTEGLKAEPSAKPSRGTRGSPSLSTGTALP